MLSISICRLNCLKYKDNMSFDENNLGFSLLRASRRWRRQLNLQLKPKGITYATWATLVYLQRGGNGITQKQLAEDMQIEGPSLVSHLDYLEKEGLIERRVSARDRRVKTVHLKEEAIRVLDIFDVVAAETRSTLFDGIDEEDIKTCLGVLNRIIRNSYAERGSTPHNRQN